MTKARNMGTADHGCKVTYSSLITGTFRRSWGKKISESPASKIRSIIFGSGATHLRVACWVHWEYQHGLQTRLGTLGDSWQGAPKPAPGAPKPQRRIAMNGRSTVGWDDLELVNNHQADSQIIHTLLYSKYIVQYRQTIYSNNSLTSSITYHIYRW